MTEVIPVWPDPRIEAELNALGFRTPRTVAESADDSKVYLVRLGNIDVVAVRIEE